MRIIVGIIGVLAVLLGGLWLGQGLDLIHIKPIACVANCEELKGPSPMWAAIGFVLAAAGVWAVRFGFFKRRPA